MFQNQITAEIEDFAKSNQGQYRGIIEKIRSYRYNTYTNDYYVFSDFIKTLESSYFDQAVNNFKATADNVLKNEIIDVADQKLFRRYDVMVQLEDKEAFDKVLAYAKDFLKGGDFVFFQQLYVNSQSLHALVQALDKPKFKNRVLEFFKDSFAYAQTYANENPKYGNSDVDGDTLLELSQAICSFQPKDREQFADLVFDIYTYCCDTERNYEANQAAGFIALQLTLFEKTFPTNIFRNVLNDNPQFQDNAFIHQTLYTTWLLEKNSTEALGYFQDQKNEKWPTYAVCALADLVCFEALPTLLEKQKTEKDPVIWEVYQEALNRLQNKYVSTLPSERMVWLNGKLTPTQRALSGDNDNEFVRRAKLKYNSIDDNVYETDEE